MENKETCKWELQSKDYDCSIYHETSCKNLHEFLDGSIKENEYKFCPFCGKEIEEVKL